MAAVRGSHTKPELLIRKALHAAGLRFRLHARDLPGKPDLVFPRHAAVVFVNGCFWHHHDCHLFKWPKTRADFWRTKITRNVENDMRVQERLSEAGWRIGIVWECALKGRNNVDFPKAMQNLVTWIRSDEQSFTIRGT